MKVSNYILGMSPFTFSALTNLRQLRILELVRSTFFAAVEDLEKMGGGFTSWECAWEWFIQTEDYCEVMSGNNPQDQKPYILGRLVDGKQQYVVSHRDQNWEVKIKETAISSDGQNLWEAVRLFDDLPNIIDPDLVSPSAVALIQRITGQP